MYTRDEFRGILFALAELGDLPLVALLLQACITLPAIGMAATSAFNAFLHERVQTGRRAVRTQAHPDPPNAATIHLRRDHNPRLSDRSPSFNALFCSAHPRVIA